MTSYEAECGIGIGDDAAQAGKEATQQACEQLEHRAEHLLLIAGGILGRSAALVLKGATSVPRVSGNASSVVVGTGHLGTSRKNYRGTNAVIALALSSQVMVGETGEFGFTNQKGAVMQRGVRVDHTMKIHTRTQSIQSPHLSFGGLNTVSVQSHGAAPYRAPMTVEQVAADGFILVCDGKDALNVLHDALKQRRLTEPLFIVEQDGLTYTRRLAGIDPSRSAFHLGVPLNPGDRITLCKNDPQVARHDFENTMRVLKAQLRGARVVAAFAAHSIIRGEAFFGNANTESRLFRSSFPGVPYCFIESGEEYLNGAGHEGTAMVTVLTSPS